MNDADIVQVKFASSHVGLVSQVAREIKDLWGVTKDKKVCSCKTNLTSKGQVRNFARCS